MVSGGIENAAYLPERRSNSLAIEQRSEIKIVRRTGDLKALTERTEHRLIHEGLSCFVGLGVQIPKLIA